jgi:hypothetical protein
VGSFGNVATMIYSKHASRRSRIYWNIASRIHGQWCGFGSGLILKLTKHRFYTVIVKAE